MGTKQPRQKFFGRWRSIPWWAELFARVGFAAKGTIYLLLGAIALYDAFEKTSANSNPTGVMHLLQEVPLGAWVLALLAAGLWCYGIHRAVEAFLGPVRTTAWWVEAAHRLGRITGGVVAIGLAFLAVDLLISRPRSNPSRGPVLAAELMRYPLGNAALTLCGAAIGLVGMKYGYDALSGRYRRSFRLRGSMRVAGWLVEIGAVYGICARAILFFLCGWLISYAGLTSESSSAHGMRGAVALIQRWPFGEWWFGVIAVGLCFYGLFCFVRSVYGVYPSDAGV